MERILTRWLDIPDLRKLDVYLANNGYKAARKAFSEMTPDGIINEIKNSNLRGRGGAAFPTGVKWSFIPKDSKKPVYVCVNGDESEPGTFANRYQFENDPHSIIEGILITCRAVGSHNAYIYMRGEFTAQQRSMDAALAEARAAGYVGKDVMGTGYSVDIWTHKGAGAYICGEESALLESLEGKRGYPRNRPPFPAISGAFGCPTVVNNIETLSNVPHIINRGAAWYKSIGPEKSPGTKLVCISGHVNKPGLYELPMGMPLREIIYDVAGGVLGGKKLKGVIPGGSSFPVLNSEETNRAIFDFDSMRTIGSAMGSGVVIVIDEDTCMIDMLLATAHFYHHESCGQCTPCREGCGWIEKIMTEMEAGQGKIEQLELLNNISDNMIGNTICVLADSIAAPAKSYVAKFRDEFEAHIRLGRCPFKTASAQQAA